MVGMLGLNFENKDKLEDIKKKYALVQKRINSWKKIKPYAEDRFRLTASGENVLIPTLPLSETDLYSLALASDVLRTGLNALKHGIFRRGTKLEGVGEAPDLVEKAKVEMFLKQANMNGQNMVTVLKQFEMDLDVLDDGYLICLKDYYFNAFGQILDDYTQVREFIRGSPLRMRIVSDMQGNFGINPEGHKLYTSPDCRSEVFTEVDAEKHRFMHPKTGKEMRQIFYRAEVDNGKYVYYFEDEVFHTPKHNPGLVYGYPPVISIWMKAVTLIQMDKFLMTAYQKGRPPRGLLTIATSNYPSALKAWEQVKAETRKDPHAITPLLYESQTGGGNNAQFIDLMRPLTEMQYIESRNEMRRAILAIYGLMPVFAGDIQMSGGMNNESQQIAVSNRALEEGQKIFNEQVFPWILKQLNVSSWELLLEEPEERDETEDEKRLGIKIDNAQKMRSMGFAVSWNEEEETFNFSEKAEEPQDPGQSFGIQSDFKPSLGGMPIMNKSLDRSAFIDLSEEIRKSEDIKKIEQVLEEEQNKIQKEGFELEIKKEVNQEIISYITKALWAKTFEGVSKSTSDQIRKVLLDGLVKKYSLQEVTNKIEKLGVEKSQAEMIARTEQQAIQNKAREFTFKKYAKEGTKFKWVSAKDDRTSDICKEITKKTKKGVGLEELQSIIKEVAKKHGSDARDWTPHVNCRSTFTPIR